MNRAFVWVEKRNYSLLKQNEILLRKNIIVTSVYKVYNAKWRSNHYRKMMTVEKKYQQKY